jgi:hypothetical protein
VQWVDYPREYLGEICFPVKELGARFRRGVGCDQCRQTGYQGRAAIYEICVVTEPLRKLIMQKRDGGELKQCAIAESMETLRQDGWRRVAQGKTTIEEVVRVTQTDEVMAETSEEAEPVMAPAKPLTHDKTDEPKRVVIPSRGRRGTSPTIPK